MESTEQSEVRKVNWKLVGGVVTILISLAALVVSIYTLVVGAPARKLTQDQIQQIIDLERATPTGQITAMIPYRPTSHPHAILNVRGDPLVFQQVYSLSVRANHVPDNGNLFIIVHNYGQSAASYSRFYAIEVHVVFGKGAVGQNWKAKMVYIGPRSAPGSPQTYRVRLYFCNSLDSEKISHAMRERANQNYGLLYLNYPSCRQLDSIFVRRASQGQR